MIGTQIHHRDLAAGNTPDPVGWHTVRVEARARVRVDRSVTKILVTVAARVGCEPRRPYE